MQSHEFSRNPLFLSVLQASQDCIRLLDLDGCVQFMNEAGKALLEIDDFERSRGLYWPDVSNTQSREEAIAAIAAARSGEVRSFRSFFPTAKGTPKWWDTTVAPVFDPDGGEVVQLMATSRDVTTQVELSNFLDAIIQVIPSVLYVKDARDGRFVLVNRKAGEAFGMSTEEIVGKTDHDFFPRAQADAFRESDLEVASTGVLRVNEEIAIAFPAGDVRYFRTKKASVPNGAGEGHLVVVAEDVTEARATRIALTEALERAEAGNRAKSDFLANMSHEIRTPMNGVIALADILARSGLTPQQLELVRMIQASGAALTSVLSDILELVGLESGGVSLEEIEFDLEGVVRGAAEQAGAQAASKGLAFDIDWRQAGGRVLGDPSRLGQVIEQLVTNAVKFTAHGQVALVVEKTPQHGGSLRLRVKDTGIGFTEAQKAKLFAPFQQADGSITRQFGGSGAGLAICRGLVAQMGGTIEAEGAPGRGACFTVEIPLRPAALTDPQAAIGESEQGPLRVLLAEDHPTNRKIVELIMGSVGADLVSVENGQLAVEAHRDRAFDVILMDIQMPVMDGLTAVRRIRERERAAGAERTPVICVTANAMPEHVEASRAADVDLHLPKPITADGLLAAIARVLPDARGGRDGPIEDALAAG